VNIGQKVTYTATITPTPPSPSGTVAFFDGTTVIPGCAARPINSRGLATCSVVYAALGTHVISDQYTGSPNGAFAGSSDPLDATVRVASYTRPRLGFGSRQITLSVACPAHSGGCRVTSAVQLSLVQVNKTINVGTLSAKLKTGRAARFTFVLNGKAHALVHSYVSHHHRASLVCTLYRVVQQGNGTTEAQTFTYTITNAHELRGL
jgi:hypothetical protein